ncbi:FG-GAP-like repeat-containing protein [Streptomyces sp. NPDC018833]|uniref:FG-GAP-like repeat-containing protein n=1 Tax=Streptomyces sp. NPDC018833 TaxID=3365053 RepID=UPI0037A31DC1
MRDSEELDEKATPRTKVVRPGAVLTAALWPLRRVQAVGLVLAMAAASLVVVGTAATPVFAAPLDNTPLITHNLQGAQSSSEDDGTDHNKWQEIVGGYAEAAEIVAIQEAGPADGPGNSQPVRNIMIPALPQGQGDRGFVQQRRWTYHRASYEVYFLQTDARGGQWTGGRTNLALVTQRQADEVTAIPNPVAGGRPALGVRFGNDWYFTWHGRSMGPNQLNDSQQMVQAIAGWVNQVPGRDWTVMADFNQEPGQFGLPPNTQAYRTGQPTHQSGRELDWAISSRRIPGHPVRRMAGALPDHYAVAIGAMRAGAEPKDLRIEPTGDSITYGTKSSHGSGYRKAFFTALLAGLTFATLLKKDFVGSQRSGAMEDPDHEGHPGWEINDLARIIEGSVSSNRPNVVTLHMGTNDMNNGHAEGAPGRLDGLISKIQKSSPGVTVLVATLVPASNPGVQDRIEDYNEQVRAIVKRRKDDGERVLLVEMSTVTTADLADGLHPNDAGYAKMADAFDDALGLALEFGWIEDPSDAGGPLACTTAGGWYDRGQIASGVGGLGVPGDQVRFADINGDGKDDYLVVADDGTVSAWYNNAGASGAPTWTRKGNIIPGTPADEGEQVMFADIDGNGRDDYLAVSENGAVRAMFNTDDGPEDVTWVDKGKIASGVGDPRWNGPVRDRLQFADINGDGKDDYLVVADDGRLYAWVNSGGDSGGKPGWVEWGDIAPGVDDIRSAEQIRVADLTGDGLADYLIVSDSGAVMLRENAFPAADPKRVGWVFHSKEIASGVGASRDHLRFADLVGDRSADYGVVSDTGNVKVWENSRANGADWTPRGQIATGLAGPQLDFADMDGDGREDYLVVSANGAVKAWLNRGGDSGGSAGWAERGQIASGVGGHRDQVRFADVNGDGRDDYLVLHKDGAVDAWLNTGGDSGGTAWWTSRGRIASGVGATMDQIRFADVNGDGRDDYLVVSADGAVKAWLNRGGDSGGSAGWAERGQIASGVGATREQIRFADINADHRDDYLVLSENGAVKAWQNNCGDPA